MEIEDLTPKYRTLDEELFLRDIKSIYMSLRRAMAIVHAIANQLDVNLKDCDRNPEIKKTLKD
jgi:hypothetical protein